MRIGILLVLSLAFPAAASTPPTFDCHDREGSSIRIWIGPQANAMEVSERGRTRRIPLSGANAFRPRAKADEARHFVGWNAGGRGVVQSLNLAQEVTLRYLLID